MLSLSLSLSLWLSLSFIDCSVAGIAHHTFCLTKELQILGLRLSAVQVRVFSTIFYSIILRYYNPSTLLLCIQNYYKKNQKKIVTHCNAKSNNKTKYDITIYSTGIIIANFYTALFSKSTQNQYCALRQIL